MADNINFSGQEGQEKLEQLLQENIQLTRDIHKMSKRVNRYVTIQHFLSVAYLLLFVVPLIIGAIYLPTLLQNYLSPYMELMGDSNNTIDSVGGYNNSAKMMDIIDQAQKIINNQNNQ